jgi:DNA mismatch endonuclease (patch repair protein)
MKAVSESSTRTSRHPAEPQVAPERSVLMSKVRGKNTKPELVVRGLLHSLAYRFRLHQSKLPGTPDLVFPKRRKVIFVHGCFWHRHTGCPKTTSPKTRRKFWREKFATNKARDRRNIRALKALGWQAGVVWECETRDLTKLSRKIKLFLGPAASNGRLRIARGAV